MLTLDISFYVAANRLQSIYICRASPTTPMSLLLSFDQHSACATCPPIYIPAISDTFCRSLSSRKDSLRSQRRVEQSPIYHSYISEGSAILRTRLTSRSRPLKCPCLRQPSASFVTTVQRYKSLSDDNLDGEQEYVVLILVRDRWRTRRFSAILSTCIW